jgi:hypothetical protein
MVDLLTVDVGRRRGSGMSCGSIRRRKTPALLVSQSTAIDIGRSQSDVCFYCVFLSGMAFKSIECIFAECDRAMVQHLENPTFTDVKESITIFREKNRKKTCVFFSLEFIFFFFRTFRIWDS